MTNTRHLWYTQAHLNKNVNNASVFCRCEAQVSTIHSVCVVFIVPFLLQLWHQGTSLKERQEITLHTVWLLWRRQRDTTESHLWFHQSGNQWGSWGTRPVSWKLPGESHPKSHSLLQDREEEREVHVNVKPSFFPFFLFAFYISACTHWRGTGFCLFWFRPLCPPSQKCPSRLCSQGR